MSKWSPGRERALRLVRAAALLGGLAWAAGCGDGATEPPPTLPTLPTPPPPDPPRPTTVTVNPATTALDALGATVRLTAEVRDQNGQAMAGASVSWSSGDASVAKVDDSVLVRGVGEGSATIITASGDAWGTSEIAVYNPDREVLVAFYRATDGPNWVNNKNWLTDAPLGEWYGVETDGYGRAESLMLGDNGLTGSIPPDIASLDSLAILNEFGVALWMTELSGGSECWQELDYEIVGEAEWPQAVADAAGALAPGVEVLFSTGIPETVAWRR